MNLRPIIMSPGQLRTAAERCRRLARDCSLTAADERLLLTIADEYEALIPSESKESGHAV